MTRRIVGVIAFSLAVAMAGCGSESSSTGSSAMTAAKVDAAVNKSAMKSAHFTAEGYFATGANRYAFSGVGDLQKSPVFAMQMTLTVQTYSALGDVTVKIVEIGDRTYTQFGSGAWTSAAATSTFPTGTPTDYVGEETRAGDRVWHVRTVADGNVADEWVRETDGFIVLMTFTDANGGSYDLFFTSYNKSPTITAP